MKTPIIIPLKIPAILSELKDLSNRGKLAVSDEIVFLDIDDEYIHRLFPLLKKLNVQKPDYFGEGLIGAHITVIYPEENVQIDRNEMGKEHHFSIKGVFSADINLKRYYVLMVKAPTLLELRTRYGLGDKLLFKDYLIDFHVTIGVELMGQ